MPNVPRRLLLLLLVVSAPLGAQLDSLQGEAPPLRSQGLSAPTVPEALRPWIPWVLEAAPEGQDQRACPIDPADGARLCAWPERLDLALSRDGGTFAQVWQVFAESAVPLPGDVDAWPLGVETDGAALPVIQRDGRPTLTLPAGVHRVTGRFVWDRPPDALLIPPMVGLVSLVRDGVAVPTPRLDRANRLWLGDPTGSETERSGDRLSLEVYRRIQDGLPLEVLTRLQLEVSGGAREVRLGPVLLPGGIPLRVDSPLPARLEEDGMLRVQVRPGRWALDVVAHHQGDVSELARGKTGAPWPEQEIWAFAAEPALRRVEPAGLDAVDPRQTGIPEDWMRLPVYRAAQGAVLRLTEQVRGDPDPGPDRLRLDRELWLDFDGKGYSVQDRIRGQLSRGWRLDAGPALALGAVTVDGSPVLITRLNDAASPGVEVRRGSLDVVADARLESAPGRVPASGWATEFENVDARLYLPPGWDLVTVQGVDNLPNTWVGRWSLLDLFLVLITTFGIGRIWGWGWALLALVTLGLTWQAPGAPRLIWLHLLAAAALLRLIPDAPVRSGLRRLRTLVTVYFRLALLGLLVIGLPFLVTEVRDGLFPHLERPWVELGDAGSGTQTTAAPAPSVELRSTMDMEATSKRERLSDALAEPAAPIPEPIDLMDPDARLQTGAGIPDWRWNSVDLRWSGPVGEQESARLWLLTPTLNLLLSLLGAVLLVLLGLRLAGLVGGRGTHGASLALLVALGLGTTLATEPASAEDLPSPELLEELRTRLLAPPDCLPHCVDLPLMVFAADPDRLVLDVTLDAAVAVAAPVPGGAGGWLPTEIRVDGQPSDGLRQDAAGRLLLMLPAGRHAVRLLGPLASRDQVEIPLPMQPRLIRATVEGWNLEGLDADGRAGAQLRLVRLSETGAPQEASLAQGALPPLLRVERTLRMGIDWRVDTRVQRLSPSEFPILIPVPLLPGESVQSPGVQVEGAAVLADLPAGRSEVAWSSRLEPIRELSLVATVDPRLSEDWRLDVGPLWHLEYAGIAPIHRLGPADRWLPNWRPLPGETLVLTLTRPPGVPGPTLTIDRVDTRVEPGYRGTLSTLTLAIRSSQGGSHVIQLPDAAEPIAFSIDGRSLPLPDTAPEVELPLTPGSTAVELTWRELQPLALGYRPNLPDLRSPAVNLNLSVGLPDDRWVLWIWGPRIGPAVLFWGILLVLIGLATGLGRSRRLTPLRVHDWLLLGIGLILAEVWVVLLVIGWLFALGLRHRLDPLARPAWRFNLIQAGLVVLTLFALAGLLGAVQQGLLGTPEMQIMGNGSTATTLNWYQDRGGPMLPEVWVLSVPMWVYRALMLAWALWLAMRLLDWLRWGWEGLSKPLIWRETPAAEPKRSKAKRTPDTEEMRLDL